MNAKIEWLRGYADGLSEAAEDMPNDLFKMSLFGKVEGVRLAIELIEGEENEENN